MMLFSDVLIDPQSITDKLIPNGIWPFIIQLISTFVMLLIVHKFLYQPIKNILDTRANFVRKTIEDAIEREKLAKASKIALDLETKKVQDALKRLREEALEEIETTKTQLLEDAQAQATRIKQKTSDEIIQAKAQALFEIEKEMVTVALDASKQVLQRELTKQDNDKVIENFIKGLRN